MLEESVVYQDIFRKGRREGIQQGAQHLVLIQLEERFGKLSLATRKQIDKLGGSQLESLGKALIHFTSKKDLTNWLRQQNGSR